MSLSISATTKLLGSLNHKPQKKLGQNFLVDGNIVRKSLSMASLKKGDLDKRGNDEILLKKFFSLDNRMNSFFM